MSPLERRLDAAARPDSLEELEDAEGCRVGSERGGKRVDRGVDRGLAGSQPLEQRIERTQDSSRRLLVLPGARDPSEDDRCQRDRQHGRCSLCGMTTGLEEVGRAGLERDAMHERETQIDERRQLKTGVAYAAREPDEERTLCRPRIRQRGAGQRFGESDRTEGEPDRPEHRRRLSRASEEDAGKDDVGGSGGELRNSLLQPAVAIMAPINPTAATTSDAQASETATPMAAIAAATISATGLETMS